VLSGTAENVRRLHDLMQEVGEDPDLWLPAFKRSATSARTSI
jgi:hypothetical protein